MVSPPLFGSQDETGAFQSALATRSIGKRIVFMPSVQSTNDLALQAARDGAEHGALYVADAQESGRGRRGRQWECPPGKGLLFSVLIRPRDLPSQWSGWIPLIAGYSCAQALSAISPRLGDATIKWPNDIVLPSDASPGWKKLGGILCESSLGSSPALSANSYAVIGIGLNINQNSTQLPAPAKAPAASLCTETGLEFDRKMILKRVLESLESNLDRLNADASRNAVRADIEAALRTWWGAERHLIFQATASSESRPRTGRFAGLDEFGRIRIVESGIESAHADAEIISLS